MPRYFAVLTIVLMLGMVLTRALLMKRNGIEAMNFGKIDKTDFLIPPFALFYFYIVFAATFNFLTVSAQEFFHSGVSGKIGLFRALAIDACPPPIWYYPTIFSFAAPKTAHVSSFEPAVPGVSRSQRPRYGAVYLLLLRPFTG